MATTPSEDQPAVVFDMDGVLVDSEQLWDEVREHLARERGGRWHDRAQADMMGMSSPEWSRYMHDVIGLSESPDEINAEVVRRLLARYRESLPLVDGAVEAVERLAARWPLGRRVVVEPRGDRRRARRGRHRRQVRGNRVLRGGRARQAGAGRLPRGGAAARRRRRGAAQPSRTHANGIRSAHAAGMRVIAIPNAHYPPSDDALALADVVLASLDELTVERVSAS